MGSTCTILRLFVDLLYNLLYNDSAANPQQIELTEFNPHRGPWVNRPLAAYNLCPSTGVEGPCSHRSPASDRTLTLRLTSAPTETTIIVDIYAPRVGLGIGVRPCPI